MITFLVTAGAALVGSLLANAIFYIVLGKLAQKAERERVQELKKLEAEYLETIKKERIRMQAYAKMEG